MRRGMEISRWKNDQELGGGVERKPGVGRGWHEVEINTNGAGHDDIIALVVAAERDRSAGVLDALTFERSFRESELSEADE